MILLHGNVLKLQMRRIKNHGAEMGNSSTCIPVFLMCHLQIAVYFFASGSAIKKFVAIEDFLELKPEALIYLA